MDLSNSLLTNQQREYLADGKDGAAGRMARKRIKERVREGLRDFPQLVMEFHEEGLGDAFEYQDEEKKDNVMDILPSMVAFLYLGIRELRGRETAIQSFENVVGSGVKQGLNQTETVVASVDVDVNITYGDVEKPVDEMTLSELQEFAKRGEIDREEFIEEQANRFGQIDNPKRTAETLADALGITEDEDSQ